MGDFKGWPVKHPGAKPQGCPVDGCAGSREVSVSVAARAKVEGKPGYANHLTSTNVSLCNEHALELYGQIASKLEDVR